MSSASTRKPSSASSRAGCRPSGISSSPPGSRISCRRSRPSASTNSDLAYLRSQGFPEPILERLKDFRFSGDIYAMPEGTPFFENEAVIEVVAPDGGGAAHRDPCHQPDRLSEPDRLEGGAHRLRGARAAGHRFRRAPRARDRRRGHRRTRGLYRRSRRDRERLCRPPLRRSDHRHDGAQLRPVLRRRDGRVPLLRARLSVDGAPRRHLRSDRRREEGGRAREGARRRVQGARRAHRFRRPDWRSPRPRGRFSTRPGSRRCRSSPAADSTNT